MTTEITLEDVRRAMEQILARRPRVVCGPALAALLRERKDELPPHVVIECSTIPPDTVYVYRPPTEGRLL